MITASAVRAMLDVVDMQGTIYSEIEYATKYPHVDRNIAVKYWKHMNRIDRRLTLTDTGTTLVIRVTRNV